MRETQKQTSSEYRIDVFALIRRPLYKFSEITMYGIWIYVACTLVLVGSMYGDTGKVFPTSCPVKCDLIQEIQILRQLLNQESILRIDMNTQLQELRKEIKENRKNAQSTNATIQETMVAMEKLEEATNLKLNYVNASTQRAENSINALQNTNRGTIQKLTKLEQSANTKLTEVSISIKRTEAAITAVQNTNRGTEQTITNLEQATNTNMTELNRSVKRVERSINAVQNSNRSTSITLTKLEQDMASLNRIYQGNIKLLCLH